MLFTKLPTYCLTSNIVERLKVSVIKRSFDNRIYESDPLNANFDELPFDVDESLITIRQIYCINYEIMFRLNSGSSINVKTNRM